MEETGKVLAVKLKQQTSQQVRERERERGHTHTHTITGMEYNSNTHIFLYCSETGMCLMVNAVV